MPPRGRTVRRIKAIRPDQRIKAIAAHSSITTLLLLIAAAIAVAWASSPAGAAYESLAHRLREPVNEGLMTLFFLVVGVHIHREITVGSLRGWKRALLPIIGAVGGMLLPALFYVALAGGGEASAGWAIPTATDIAFVAALVRLGGDSVPEGLVAFVLALAVADDIGAIAIVAIVYGGSPGIAGMLLAVGATAGGAVAARRGVGSPWFYVAAGAAIWWGLHVAGVHPALSGIALAAVLPEDIAARVEEHIGPWAEAIVLPLFAFANAGIEISASTLARAADSSVTLGVAVGLVLGKGIGITGASLLAARAGWGNLPEGVLTRHLLAGAVLCGVGFTVSLVITDLAFPAGPVRADAIAGVFAGSLVAAGVGLAILRGVGRRRPARA